MLAQYNLILNKFFSHKHIPANPIRTMLSLYWLDFQISIQYGGNRIQRIKLCNKMFSIIITKRGKISTIFLILETLIKAKANYMQNRTQKIRTNMLSTIRINAGKKNPAPEFRWTDDELGILLQAWVQYKSQQEYSVVNWGKTVWNKYEAIREIFVKRITFSDGLSFIQS